MADKPLPQGIRVQLVTSAAVAVLVVLSAAVLALLIAADGDVENPAVPILILVLVVAALLGLLGFASRRLVKRGRQDSDFRRRQLNGRAQATLTVGVLVAYPVAKAVSTVLGVQGLAEVPVIIGTGLVLLVPVMLLARRFDPRVRWFRRPEPLSAEEDEQQQPTRGSGRPW